MATKYIWVVEGGNVNCMWLSPTTKRYKVVQETSDYYVVATGNTTIYIYKTNMYTRIFLTSVSAKDFVQTMYKAEVENCENRIKRLKPKIKDEVPVLNVL